MDSLKREYVRYKHVGDVEFAVQLLQKSNFNALKYFISKLFRLLFLSQVILVCAD